MMKMKIFLILLIPPSFDFSPPEKIVEEKEDYSRIIEFLDDFDFNRFGSFALIPFLEADPGRSNPFLEGTDEIEEEEEPELIDEETEIQ